ncbi:cartilage acidic protein 1 isoform X2 [Cyprinodon tularosa]|uniref:cartilage acidic protein 1 isoform X2 n=1 Tax=Cyprinodon tularosa TaxID=77115 RepID=UPI0018E2356C|nr:cartilage acidic protein 1 isoform X2 [Cyprinodon tularosa]
MEFSERLSAAVRMLLCLLLFLPAHSTAQRSEPMFAAITKTALRPDYENNPSQLNYGMAVTDVDGDGDLEIFVAGYNGPNLVLKYDKQRKGLINIAIDDQNSPFYALRDRQGNAIGVTACDIDGDGREEIYVLNTNNAFSGRATYSDKLFKFRNGRFEDLLNDDINEHRDVANPMAGRSVACVDRKGTGRYAIYIANYASGNVGPHALIEMDEAASDLSQGVVALSNVAEQAGVNKLIGGRGVVVGPIVSQTLSDIFCDNEYGSNFLFRNNGDGTFTDVAQQAGVEDPMQHGRGVALADFNRDGRTDIVYGNWNGPHRLYIQLNNRKQKFKDIASQKFSMPSPVRTVIAADFDNDNELEVFFNNIAYREPSANRLFRVSRREHGDPQIEELNIGEAAEPDGRGTGAIATDFDGDGRLELVVSHGESAAQPLSVYKVNQGLTNSWLRVIPRTKFGAFARGAKVVVYTKKSGPHTRIIDGGSGYLCEMEPVAHFGLGRDVATNVEVYWPDGRSIARPLEPSEINSVLEIPYPRDEEEVTPTVEIECGHGFALNEYGRCTAQVAYFGRKSSSGECNAFHMLTLTLLLLISAHLQIELL